MLERKFLYYVGNLCRQVRERYHFSQIRTAIILEKSQSNISRFEQGSIDSATTLAWYIAKCFNDKDIAELKQICKEYIDSKSLGGE